MLLFSTPIWIPSTKKPINPWLMREERKPIIIRGADRSLHVVFLTSVEQRSHPFIHRSGTNPFLCIGSQGACSVKIGQGLQKIFPVLSAAKRLIHHCPPSRPAVSLIDAHSYRLAMSFNTPVSRPFHYFFHCTLLREWEHNLVRILLSYSLKQ
jgi:hypothetical protein